MEIRDLEEATNGVMTMKMKDQLTSIKQVWKEWIRLSRQDNQLSRQRAQEFNKLDARMGMKTYLDEIPENHKMSSLKWFGYGVLMSERKRQRAFYENFTLTGCTILTGGKFKYCIASDCVPFCGWDYKDVSTSYPKIDDVNEMFNRYITDVLGSCAERLKQGQIHIEFLLCSCDEVPRFIEEGVKFDRISTSNLWDYIPLKTLFTTFKPLMNPNNRSAVLITESQNWTKFFPLLEVKKAEPFSLSSDFRAAVLFDTDNPSIAQTIGTTGFKDYLSFAMEFTCFARASLLDVSKKSSSSFIPSLEQLAKQFGFKPRDFLNHGNRVSPFRWKLNCRRVTLLRGQEFTVEWTLA